MGESLLRGSNDLCNNAVEFKKRQYAWRFILAIHLVSLGSSIPSGYSLGVLNTPQHIIRAWIQTTLWREWGLTLTPDEEAAVWGAVVAIFIAGAAVGSFLGTLAARSLGKRGALFLNHSVIVISSLIVLSCSYFSYVEVFLLSRILSGLATGASTCLVPLYLSDLAPSSWKGSMGAMFPLGLTTGILMSQIFGISYFINDNSDWTYVVGGHGLPAAIALLFHFLLPHPLMQEYFFRKDHKMILAELSDIHMPCKEKGCLQEQLKTFKEDGEDQKEAPEKDLKTKPYMLFVCVALLNIGQQLSGINAVFYYSTDVLTTAGLGLEVSQAASLGAGVANVLMASLALPLSRYCKRRVLLLTSLFSYSLCLALFIVTLHYATSSRIVPLVAMGVVFCSVLTYGLGLGPVPYMSATEMFPPESRSRGLSVGGVANWGSNLFVGLLFPTMQHNLGLWSFLIFICCNIFLALFVIGYVPETFKKTEEKVYSRHRGACGDCLTDSAPLKEKAELIEMEI